jgi:hypothetical protein
MICGNCLNGETRPVGDNIMVKCFLNPEIIMKGEFERCAQGQWVFDECIFFWGEI